MITRFAPSPTGDLHLGHLAHMLYVWGVAKRMNAQVLLRIEDHDRGRCRRKYEAAILEDLRWLALVPDAGFDTEHPALPSAYRQSDCESRYRETLERLASHASVYGCSCSRREIIARTGDSAGELRYDNHCRARGLPLTSGVAWRVALPDEPVSFQDIRLGAQTQQPQAQCGDLVLRDRHGHWTYQFCVVADDLEQGIDLVIRGEDLLASTGRQILLAQLLGRTTPPRFLHHPLITDPQGRKLSKRDFDESLADLRRAKLTPEEAIGAAVHAVGLAAQPEAIRLQEALEAVASSL